MREALGDELAATEDLPPATVDRESIPEIVYQTLRRDIAHGRYKPGVLRIRPLAERFGVSATPIREALRRLEAEGLVTLHNRRIMVKAVSEEELREIFAIRIVLETFAIAQAAERPIDDDTRERLDAFIVEMEETAGREPDRWRAANQGFHMLLYELAGSPRLMSMIDSLWVSVEPYLRLYVHAAPGLTTAQKEHVLMLDAVRRGRGQEAADILRTHLTTTQDIVQRGFARDQERA